MALLQNIGTKYWYWYVVHHRTDSEGTSIKSPIEGDYNPNIGTLLQPNDFANSIILNSRAIV